MSASQAHNKRACPFCIASRCGDSLAAGEEDGGYDCEETYCIENYQVGGSGVSDLFD